MVANKDLIRRRFEANLERYHKLALVQKKICAELGRMAAGVCDPDNISFGLEIGVGTGFLTEHLISLYPHAKWYLNDITDASEGFVSQYTGGDKTSFLLGDAETLSFPQDLDMIATASTVQWFDDLPAFARRAADATRSGGWILLSTFGPRNFYEIRELTGEGLDYYSLDQLREIFEDAGYKIRSITEYTRSLHFGTPMDVLHHIKATGVNSLRSVRWGREQFAHFDEHYRMKFSDQDGVTLTYHPQLILAQKP